jgi:putative DNA primase/helicase
MTRNIAAAFQTAMAEAGLGCQGEIIPDGTIQRFDVPGDKPGQNNGWYVVFPDDPAAGSAGSWKTGEQFTWCSRSENDLTPAERQFNNTRMEAARAVREAERAATHTEAAAKAERLWQAATAPQAHAYLERKGVKPWGVRQHLDTLAIPMRDSTGKMHSLQFIGPDGSKRFLTGGAKAGHYHAIGKGGAVILIAEGYATAASLHEAAGLAVAVAFDAGNLLPVARAMRAKFPNSKILIAGDDDAATDGNPGATKAQEAAEAIGGLSVLPDFGDNRPDKVTDWNDLHALAGLDEIKRQIDAALTKDRQPKPAASHMTFGPYQMRRDGLYLCYDDPEKPPLKLSGPFHVDTQTTDGQGNAWGRLIIWDDAAGFPHEWPMPYSMLSGDGSAVRERLMDGGLYITPSQGGRVHFNAYLLQVKAPSICHCVTKTGWHGGQYILPDRSYGEANRDRMIFQTTGEIPKFECSGTLAGWQGDVAAYAIGNSRLALAISAAFAGPLIHLVNEESGGFHFAGGSSSGKTTALHVAKSVWGVPLRTWRTTDNSAESWFASANDGLIALDELSQVDGRAADAMAYMLGNGAGKGRAGRSGSARAVQTWRVMALSSGEIGMSEKLGEVGKKAKAGQSVRLIEIPADTGAGFKLFETLNGFPSGDALSKHLKAASERHKGHAIGEFLERVAPDHAAVADAVKQAIAEWTIEHLPEGADGQVSRVAARFGLVAAAGELAAAMGILPWLEGEACNAAAICFRAWLDRRGGAGAMETDDAIAQVRAFIEQHGASRFEPIGEHTPEYDHKIINRAGFKRKDEQGRWEYLALTEAWKNEVCKGIDARAAAKMLIERGMMMPGQDGKAARLERLPGMGPSRVYVLTSSIIGGE